MCVVPRILFVMSVKTFVLLELHFSFLKTPTHKIKNSQVYDQIKIFIN